MQANSDYAKIAFSDPLCMSSKWMARLKAGHHLNSQGQSARRLGGELPVSLDTGLAKIFSNDHVVVDH